MTREEIAAIVESMNLPCAYYEFNDDTPQEPPFICWFFSSDNDFKADNENFSNIEVLNIELYTKYKDFEQDDAVEAVLKQNGLVWYKETNYIENEKMYQTAYECQVVITASE